jgi:hypothetical protein
MANDPKPYDSVYKYAGYELVEESEEYEYRNRYYFHGGSAFKDIRRRKIHTKTWEATLTDDCGEVKAYKHDQGYPGAVNPGDFNVQTSNWRLQAVEYTKSLSQPMSKVVRETWIEIGNWETVDESDSY